MPNGFIPPWSPWYAARPRAGVPNPEMRVGDAERSAVSDALSKHYADGRLDEAEFNERLHRAMSAKTRGDLAGLLADLPAPMPPPPTLSQTRRHNGRLVLFALLLLLFVTAASWPWAPWFHVPWLLIAFVVFLCWRRSKWSWHRHRHDGWHGHQPMAQGPYSRQGYGQGGYGPGGYGSPPPPPPPPGDQGNGWWV